MRGLNFRQLKEDQTTAIAVESERRLALPCGEIALEIEAMLRERRLSGAGYGFTVKLFEDWIRVDLDREALGLPQA